MKGREAIAIAAFWLLSIGLSARAADESIERARLHVVVWKPAMFVRVTPVPSSTGSMTGASPWRVRFPNEVVVEGAQRFWPESQTPKFYVANIVR
jgi:hypothetical protein